MTLVRLTFQQLKKCNPRNHKTFLEWTHQMTRCCYSLVVLLLSPGANQKKREKDVGVGNIWKRRESGVYHNLLQEISVNDRGSAFRVICIMDFLAKLMKKNVQLFKAWLGPLLENAQLLSKNFLYALPLCILYFLFHKDKDTSAIPQPSVQCLVCASPIFFRFDKCFNNFHLSKNIFVNKFFHWTETCVSS